jgi:anaerobic dimethyl sulfoxide reductase subunit A
MSKKVVKTLHPMHCGGGCLLHLHIKNGKIDRITSAGDIPREGAYLVDESLGPIQRRACLLGLSEKKRINAPDRLKHPLIQTKSRGDIRGFKRVSWDEALDKISGWYKESIDRKDELGYLPVWDEGGVAKYLGPYLARFGNPSSGNLQAATYAAIGEYSTLRGNPVLDIFNSKFILIWGNDIQATVPYASFAMMKAKESGIPITVVDTRYTDTASSFSTGSVEVPPHICIRPGTDGAFLSAMANVIYRRKLHDVEFIREYCFGFFPEDKVVSLSPKKHPITGENYKGKEFKVPSGQSFVDYLDELEKQFGGYDGVLVWAANLTGTSAEVIENLSIQYATTKPAFICSKLTGPQRTQNGMYFSWLLIALSAMTGNSIKRGGGFGDIRTDDGYAVKFEEKAVVDSIQTFNPIYFSTFRINDVLLSGLDGRTHKQLREDIIQMNDIDIGENKGLEIDTYVRGAVGGNVFNQFQNVNRKRFAWNRLKHVVSYERFMSTTAVWSDIVLPVTTDFEQSRFAKQTVADTYVINGSTGNLYSDARPDEWINAQIAKRLGVEIVYSEENDLETMKCQWKCASIPEEYKAINSDIQLPSFEEIIKMGNFQLPVPIDKTVIQLADIKPGEFNTDTGRINFSSPFLEERNRTVLRVNRAQYVRPDEGYEDVIENGGVKGLKGIIYSLQFITPHLSHRALSTYGNMPIIADQRPHVVEIHPLDAKPRGISDGKDVYVFNDIGCIKILAKVTNRIMPGVISIGQGSTYRPSQTEYYEAWFDTDDDGIPEKHTVPLDVGGCTNTITYERNSGVLDPFFCGLGLNAGGALCEVSTIKPD